MWPYPPDDATIPAPIGRSRRGPRVALVLAAMLAGALLLAGSLSAALAGARSLVYPQPTVTLSYVASGPPRVGMAIQFAAQATLGHDLTYIWDFGDHTTGAGATTSHTYAAFGDFTATVTARDPVDQTALARTTLHVLPLPPRAAFTYTLDGSLIVLYDASASTGASLRYTWDFGDGSAGSGTPTKHLYANPGTYTVKLTVTDVAGQTDATSQQVTLILSPPQASFMLTQNPSNPLTIGFDARNSSGYELNYSWDFGDGTGGSGVSPQHTYPAPGFYVVTLTVTDGFGQQASTTQAIPVPLPPQG